MSSLNLSFTSGMASLQLGSLSTLNTLSENTAFDWNNEDNAWKWKGQFVQSLGNVLKSVHSHQFSAESDALDYVEGLLIKLLAMITAKPVPSTVSDVEVLLFF
jgi:son of sevenless-like protein